MLRIYVDTMLSCGSNSTYILTYNKIILGVSVFVFPQVSLNLRQINVFPFGEIYILAMLFDSKI